VDPFVALARRARSAGHEVRVGVTREFVGRVEAAGLDVAVLDGDYSALVAGQGAGVGGDAVVPHRRAADDDRDPALGRRRRRRHRWS
jgi:hypothetical protein